MNYVSLKNPAYLSENCNSVYPTLPVSLGAVDHFYMVSYILSREVKYPINGKHLFVNCRRPQHF